jgi:hypothetical protein
MTRTRVSDYTCLYRVINGPLIPLREGPLELHDVNLSLSVIVDLYQLVCGVTARAVDSRAVHRVSQVRLSSGKFFCVARVVSDYVTG